MDALGNVTLIGISFLALAMHGVASARDKTDILILKNGDRITGEISKLEYGKLEFKTSDIGTLSVEWTAVATLSSTYSFDVEVASGEHFFGALAAAPDGRGVMVAAAPRPAELATLDVVRIAQLEKRWLERISGSLAFGYNFTKSSDIKVLSAHFDASYRARETATGLRADTTSTTSPEEGTLDRLSIAFNYQWLRPNASSGQASRPSSATKHRGGARCHLAGVSIHEARDHSLLVRNGVPEPEGFTPLSIQRQSQPAARDHLRLLPRSLGVLRL